MKISRILDWTESEEGRRWRRGIGRMKRRHGRRELVVEEMDDENERVEELERNGVEEAICACE